MRRNHASILVVILALVLSSTLLLAGCGGGSDNNSKPEPASELAPEQEPEQAHEHVWTEATFWEPKTCSECGQTEGSPLTPALEACPLQYIEVGDAYHLTTVCSFDLSKTTVGQLKVINYRVVEAEGDFKLRDGYEWRIVRFISEFSDENANDYGYFTPANVIDYYLGEGYPDYPPEIVTGESGVEYERVEYPVTITGQSYRCECLMRVYASEWRDTTSFYDMEYAISVPAGYDGLVMAFFNAKYITDDAGNILEDSLSYGDLLPLDGILADTDSLFFRLT